MSVARAQPSAEIQGWRSGRTSLACAGRRPATARRCAVPVTAGLFDDLFNYGAWAPKSAQRWRLQKMGNDREGGSLGGGAIRRVCAVPVGSPLPPLPGGVVIYGGATR